MNTDDTLDTPLTNQDDGDGRAVEEATAMDHNTIQNKFTQIQHKKYRSSTHFPTWSLCPTMDLIALGSCTSVSLADELAAGGGGSGGGNSGGMNVAESIAVHRILSWQGLLLLKSEQLTSSKSSHDDGGVGSGSGFCLEDIERECVNNIDNDDPSDDNESDDDDSPQNRGATSVCWSPNGRYLAVGLVDGGILVHTVEPDAAAEASSLGGGGGANSGTAAGAAGGGEGHSALHLIRPPPYDLHRALISPAAAVASAATGGGGKKQPFISPRVTRSMAAKREGGSGSKKQHHASRSKSPRGLKINTSTHASHSSAVIGMTWNRLSPLPRQKVSKDELETRESWRYTSQLIDRGAHFLPHNTTKSTNNGSGVNSISSTTHLNVLCVATAHEIHWYVQGQYRILSIPHGLLPPHQQQQHDGGAGGGIDMVCSPDLSTLLAVTRHQSGHMPSSPKKVRNTSTKPMKARLFHTSLLSTKRYKLQILAASYKSIFTHLYDAKRGMQAALASWKTALRALDTKFRGLLSLLTKYNIDSTGSDSSSSGSDAVRLELLRFILSGRSTVAGNASSALDQFFTRAQMHDQLLQREGRNVEAGVASMEGALRSNVLSSIRAVVYQTEELYGLASSQRGDSRNLLDAKVALGLYNASRVLYMTFERCLVYVVEARTRIHDLLAWLRGTASQVRAWGTAPDSIQRQNARARRVSHGVVQRVSAFLSNPMMFALKGCVSEEDLDHRILTECIIGVPLCDFFVTGNQQQPSSSAASDYGKENIGHATKSIRSLRSTVQALFQITTILFDKPRNVFAQSLTAIDICFEVQHSVVATHTRIGAGSSTSSGDEGDEAKGFFLPKTVGEDPAVFKCPSWTILARSLGTHVEFLALPGGASFDSGGGNGGYYLRADLMIPEKYEVTSIAFYSDDGNSSLSPKLDEDSEIKEGRQSVGFIVKCLGSESQETRDELWLLRYDDIMFRKFDITKNAKNEAIIHGTNLDEKMGTVLSLSDEDGNESTIVPKRRQLGANRKNSQTQQQSQVHLCGSRGTGGVITFGPSTSLTMFDFEEDEEEEDDDDNEEMEDAADPGVQYSSDGEKMWVEL